MLVVDQRMIKEIHQRFCIQTLLFLDRIERNRSHIAEGLEAAEADLRRDFAIDFRSDSATLLSLVDNIVDDMNQMLSD